MTYKECKVGVLVVDRWFSEWGVGRITKVLKTRIRIQFAGELLTYDKEHLQFLDKSGIKKRKPKAK